MDAQHVKSQIKRIAKEFGLKYNATMFKYAWVPVRHEILSEYIGLCPDPVYQKYGKTGKQRAENIGRFVSSKDFQKCMKRYGGQALQKSEMRQNERLAGKIKDVSLRNELLGFYRKLRDVLGKAGFIALLTIPRNKKEKDWQLRFCLRHEWIHILLGINKIQFQKINRGYWAYDEGINEYMTAFIDGKLGILEKLKDREKYPIEKKYFSYAMKFRKLLRKKKSPEERIRAIFINNNLLK